MNIDELRSVQSRERSTSELQDLRDSFYADVAEYVAELRAERDRLAAEREDPYDDEVIRLTDEVRTAEQVAESIYERRVGKVVKRASFAANGFGDEPTGLTAEERTLYEDIVDRIEENKATVLDVIADNAPGETLDMLDPPEESPDDEESEPVPIEEGGVDTPTDQEGLQSVEEHADPSEASDDRETVRITEDVGEIYGVDDRVYTLETDDVVRLPTENAGPLIERGAAESLE